MNRLVVWITSAVFLATTFVRGDQPSPPQTNQDRLRNAVQQGDHDQVARLLAQGVKPDADPAISLLTIAESKEDPVMCELLLKAGADVNRTPSDSEPPLPVGIMAASGQIFDEVMAAHPVINHDNSEDAYYQLYSGLGGQAGPLQALKPATGPKDVAALAEFGRRLQALKRAGFDINAADDKTGETILMLAVKDHASIPILQKLVDVGANRVQRDKSEKSAIDLATAENEIDVVRLLDSDHSHAAVLHEHNIPAGSPFVGVWSSSDEMEMVELRPDGSGLYASMLACSVAWKQFGDVANPAMSPTKSNQPGLILKATARVSPDGKTLKLQFTSGAHMAGSTSELSKTSEKPSTQ